MKINLETVIADMHMHSTRSDGRHSPKEMAEAIITKIEGTEFEGYAAAALTDHDSVEGVQEFIDTCGDKIIGVPGVEIAVYDQLISLFDPALSQEERDFRIADFYEQILLDRCKKLKINPQDLEERMQTDDITRAILKIQESSINEIKNIDPKLIELKYDIDRFYKQAPNILKNYRILITPDLEELLDGTQKILDVYKSEFLCYFPISYLEKMKKAMINLKKIKNPSIYDLFKIFEDKDISFENIALVMAHPISVDASPMGRLAYILTSRKMNQRLTNVSHFIPEIAKRINGIESVNAGHDINTNLITRDYIIGENGQKNFFSGLGKSMTGNSDSHDKNWVFAGYSIIGIKEKTANDVIKSIQNGYVPSHGWGLSYVQDFAENRFGSQNKKLKWKDYLYNNKPLLQWSMLSPFSPDFVANYIGSKIKEEIIIPTKMAVIENIEKGNTPAPFCDYTK